MLEALKPTIQTPGQLVCTKEFITENDLNNVSQDAGRHHAQTTFTSIEGLNSTRSNNSESGKPEI